MANDTQANIILRLKDEFSKNLQSAGKNFESFARQVDQVGTSISRTGMRMTAVGATLTAPYLAAVKAMEKYSFDARNEMQRLDNTFLSLSKVIADAAMPAIRQMNDNFAKIVNLLKSLDPVIMQNIAKWSLLIGQILLVSGTITIFVGKAISLIGKLMNPITLVVAAMTLLTYAWIRHRDEFMKVLNMIDVSFNRWVVMMLEGIKKVVEGLLWLAKVHPAMAGTSGLIQGALDNLNRSISAFKQNVYDAQQGSGAFASSFQAAANSMTSGIQNVMTMWQNAGTKLDTVMTDMKMRMYDVATSFSDGFVDAFDKVLFEGENFKQSMQQLFQQIGRDIVKDFMKTGLKNIIGQLFGKTNTESGTGIGGLLSANLFGGLFGGLQKSSKDAASAMGQATSKTQDMTNALGQSATGLGGFFNALSGFGSGIVGLTGSLFSGISGIIGSLGGSLGGLLGGIGGGIGGAFSGIMGALGGLALFLHEGGMVRPLYAHSGLAPDEVPIIAQTGEGVLSRRGMSAIGGSDNLRRLNSGGKFGGEGGMTVVVNQVIQAWDASDVYRNRKIISSSLVNEIKNNGNLRKAIKDS